MNIIKRIVQLEHAIIFVCSVTIAFTFCLVVLLRYGFESDLFAYEEWILTIAFLLYFLGGAAATANNAHIRADIVVELIRTERSRNAFQCVVMILETVIGAFLTYYAVLMVQNEFVRWPNIPTSPVYKIPLAVPRIFILVGLALMTVHAAVSAVKYYKSFREAVGKVERDTSPSRE